MPPLPGPVSNGASLGGGSASIACRVDPGCGGFDIALDAAFSGPNSGGLRVAGHITSTGGSGISASFTQQGLVFSSSNCSFTLTYNGSPLPPSGSPAPGRIWGHIDCPTASDGQYVTNSSGMAVPRACDAWADIMFENCQ